MQTLIKKNFNNQNQTYAFIDAANLIYGTKYENWKIDFAKLIKYLRERYQVDKAYYYAGIEISNEQQKKFFEKLRQFGYHLRLKPVKLYTRDDGSVTKKANCDVGMTFDMMRFFDQYQKAIILTGDGDFAPIVEYLVDKKQLIRVIANGSRTAKELKQIAGQGFIDLRNLKDILEYNKTGLL